MDRLSLSSISSPTSTSTKLTFRKPSPSCISPLDWTLTFEDKDYSLFNGKNNSDDLIYTALVTRDTGVHISILKETCIELKLICPLEKHSYVVDGEPIMTLFYRPFQTLDAYMHNWSVSDPNFVEVVRGIIGGLNNLHIRGYVPWNLTNAMVVKGEDKKGSILLINTTKGQRSDSDCQSDFEEVHTVFKKYVDVCTDDVPFGLTTLMECMILAPNKARRQRLLDAPYFHSDWESVYGFICRLHMAVTTCREFRLMMTAARATSATSQAMNNKHEEVRWTWEENRVPLVNDYMVLIFVRNCMEHLNENWKKIQKIKIEEAATSKAQKSGNTIHKAATSKAQNSGKMPLCEASPLMIRPSLFLDDVVDMLVPDFLNITFRRSYQVTTVIPILEKHE